MNKVCMKKVVSGMSDTKCIGLKCGQYSLCNGIQNKPKQAVRKIGE